MLFYGSYSVLMWYEADMTLASELEKMASRQRTTVGKKSRKKGTTTTEEAADDRFSQHLFIHSENELSSS